MKSEKGDSLFGAAVPVEVPRGVYARVAVERGIDTIGGPQGFTYRCDGEGVEGVVRGERVMVPMGRGGRGKKGKSKGGEEEGSQVSGVVIEVGDERLAAGLEGKAIKAIAARSGVVLPPVVMDLGVWMSEYYYAPLGMTLGMMLPAAVKAKTGRKEIEMYELVRERTAEQEAGLAGLKPGVVKVWEKISALPVEAFPMPLKVLLERAGVKGGAGSGGSGGVKKLVELGVLVKTMSSEVKAREIEVFEEGGGVGGGGERVKLNEDQARAVRGVEGTLGEFAVHLVRGVTGSGKTEVYLHALESALAKGLNAVVLVPEIALTPQTASRFVARFGAGRVATLHSGLTGAQRNKEWLRVMKGEARIVVGARSAIFAPMVSVGLIIVDEEHDGSYKQDRLPRYHARDVAIKRASLEKCTIVLGSATPSLESWANTKGATPRYRLWELPKRATGAVMPPVHVVDMAAERKARYAMDHDGQQHLLGPTLERTLGATLMQGGQAVLLLNRRGFAGYISCPKANCGFVMSCDQCDVNLVLHKNQQVPSGGYVRCHHCDSRQMVPKSCPGCQGKLTFFSGGTQRLEEEMTRKFASYGLVEGETFVRVDSDSMQDSRDYFDVLGRFAKGEIKVLVGTQMLAKGLDFPNVRLVGVVDADMSLNIPDFRGSERTFQLVSQVAGRAGRGAVSGVVIVQTFCPNHPAILAAQRHDYVGFADRELAIRIAANLPPARRMARIVCRDVSREEALKHAGEIVKALKESATEEVSLRGPLPCPIERISNHYRFGIDVLAPTPRALHAGMKGLRAKGMLISDSTTAIDVDPVSLL